MDKSQKEIFDFMMSRLGGEGEVRKEFFKNKVVSLADSPKTLNEVLEEGEREGWSELFKTLRMNELRDIFRGEKTHAMPAREGKRMTKSQKESLYKDILSFVGSREWAKVSDIARHVNLPTRIVGSHLRSLRQEGKLRAEGEKASTRYTLS